MALLKSAPKVIKAGKSGAGILALSALVMIFFIAACGSLGGQSDTGGSAQNGQPGQDDQDGKPAARECYDRNTPYEVPFLVKAMENIDANLVVKHPLRDDGWAYWVQGDHTEVYDCVGFLICETKTQPDRDCTTVLDKAPGKGRIIWQAE